MKEKIEQTIIEDLAIEQGVQKLTLEKIEKTVNEVLDKETGARIKIYTQTCVHCGLCSDACHHYLSHDKDPRFSPAGKVKQTLDILIKNQGKVSIEFIKQCAQIAYTQCNLCKRCATFCPFGIDIGYMMSIIRRICHKLGVTPQYLQDTAHSHSATMNQMWVKNDEWIDSLQWQEDEARDELPGLRIPIEKEGADFMYSVIAPEPKFSTQLIYQAAYIFNACGCNWTAPMNEGWDNSDLAMFSGDSEMMGRIKRTHYEAAQRLRVKYIVMGECGHAFRSVYDTGNRWLGWKEGPIRMVHSVEFFWELLNTGKLKIAKKYKPLVTLHDPCNIARGRGLYEKSRELTKALCENFVEMTPNREQNICCGAGGGVINCGPTYKNARVESNSIKAEQIRATGAETCIAPCHNCHGGLEDLFKKYELNMELKYFGDLIYECMEKPEMV